MDLQVIDFKRVDIPSPEEVINKKEYVYWGVNNNFSSYIKDIYANCALLQTIIDGIAGYISGNEATSLQIKDAYEFINKLAISRLLYGGFAIQIIYNRVGEAYSYEVLDLSRCRFNENLTKCFYSKDFGKRNSKAIVYPTFGNTEGNKTSEVYYYKGLRSNDIYPTCPFSGALKSIETDIEIQNFHYSSIKNSFTPSCIINFNNGEPTEEAKQAVKKKIEDCYTGTDNSAKFILAFNEDKDKAVTIERLNDDNFDKKYEALEKSVKEKIFVSFRIQGILLGLPEQNKGFSKSEYSEAFELFNKTQIKPLQVEIRKAIQNIGIDIEIKPFKLTDNE